MIRKTLSFILLLVGCMLMGVLFVGILTGIFTSSENLITSIFVCALFGAGFLTKEE